MFSICIKCKNKNALNKMEELLDCSKLPSIYYSQKKYKNFFNLIIHYSGKNKNKFIDELSNIFFTFIKKYVEHNLIFKELEYDFFYFSSEEKKRIIALIKSNINSPNIVKKQQEIVNLAVSTYFFENKKCILSGFLNFRIYDYKKFLQRIIEQTIHEYVLTKEYSEYVNLLSDYITLEPPKEDLVHLIYFKNTKLLFDSSKNIIEASSANYSNLYLSDFSFNTNDYLLNSIISILPKKIIIHTYLPDDNFIIFLKNIFKDKFTLCSGCKFCKKYESNSLTN